MTTIAVIVGSTREGRFSEKPAKWIFEHMQKRNDFKTKLLDLRDYPMPFFDQPISPAVNREPYKNEAVKRWTAEIASSDSFVIVTPEYNYGPPGVLKNALDWVYPEWNRKACTFVSYGNASGARSVQQLRQTLVELQLVPVRSAVHIPPPILSLHYKGEDVTPKFADLVSYADAMIADLLWWTDAIQLKKQSDSASKGK